MKSIFLTSVFSTLFFLKNNSNPTNGFIFHITFSTNFPETKEFKMARSEEEKIVLKQGGNQFFISDLDHRTVVIETMISSARRSITIPLEAILKIEAFEQEDREARFIFVKNDLTTVVTKGSMDISGVIALSKLFKAEKEHSFVRYEDLLKGDE